MVGGSSVMMTSSEAWIIARGALWLIKVVRENDERWVVIVEERYLKVSRSRLRMVGRWRSGTRRVGRWRSRMRGIGRGEVERDEVEPEESGKILEGRKLKFKFRNEV